MTERLHPLTSLVEYNNYKVYFTLFQTFFTTLGPPPSMLVSYVISHLLSLRLEANHTVVVLPYLLLLPFLLFIIVWKNSTLIKTKLFSYFACKSNMIYQLEKNLQLCWLLSDKFLTLTSSGSWACQSKYSFFSKSTLKPDYIIVDKWSNFANRASADGIASNFTESNLMV